MRSGRARALLTAGLTAPAMALAAGLTAQAATSSGWHVVARHHYGPRHAYNGLVTIAAPGRADAWAFGGTDLSGGTPGAPIAERWNGHAWKTRSLPKRLQGYIEAASAPAGNDVWAASFLNGYLLHWNGSKWSVAKRFSGKQSPPGEITGVTAFSPSNVWVFGGSGGWPGVGTWHLHGKTWTHVTGVGGNIGLASALSKSSMWAIGGINGSFNAVLRYNGSAWTQVTDPLLSGQQFQSIYAASAKSVWVSALVGGSGISPVLLRFDGATWQQVTMPWTLQLSNLTPDGHGGFWAVGRHINTSQSWVVHRSRSGAWARYTFTKGGPLALAAIPRTAKVWGAGGIMTKTASDATIWRH